VQTTRHLAEFNMIEPEMAFADLQDDMANAEGFVKAVVGHVLQHCQEDLTFFEKFYDKGLTDRLQTVSQSVSQSVGQPAAPLWCGLESG
jgi:asparaginyl-tRNA synthetase